jgi:hypothetical protein
VFTIVGFASAASAQPVKYNWGNPADLNWNYTSYNWSGSKWQDGNTAVFGGSGGAIKVTDEIKLSVRQRTPVADNGGLQVNGGTWIFTGTTIGFTGADDNMITLNSATNLTIFNFLQGTNNSMHFNVNSGVLNLYGGATAGVQQTSGRSNAQMWFNSNGTVNLISGVYRSDFTSIGSTLNINNAQFYARSYTITRNVTMDDFNAVMSQFDSTGINSNKIGQSNDGFTFTLQRGFADWSAGATIMYGNNATTNISNQAKLLVTGGTMRLSGTGVVLGWAELAGARGNASFEIRGGLVETTGVTFGMAKDASASFDSSTGARMVVSGGTLNIGANGINKGSTAMARNTIELNDGVIGATADWSSNMDMTIYNNATFTPNDKQITMHGTLSGVGGLQVMGGGVMMLASLNTYQGGTYVFNAATLTVDTTGGLTFYLGNDGISNRLGGYDGTANLNGSIVINLDNAANTGEWLLIDDSNLTLSYGDDFTVSGWNQVDGNTWTYNDYTFSNLGGKGVVTAIPEPSAWLLLAVGIGLVVAFKSRWRRHRI